MDELIEKVKKTLGMNSDLKLADYLGISRKALWCLRKENITRKRSLIFYLIIENCKLKRILEEYNISTNVFKDSFGHYQSLLVDKKGIKDFKITVEKKEKNHNILNEDLEYKGFILPKRFKYSELHKLLKKEGQVKFI